jgi:cytochrome d ubiquinol oxidase subunit II
MNLLYFLNYIIFAAFLTMFILEVGIAILFTLFKEYNEKLRTILMPLWGITGTFAIFYIVNFEATYPPLLPLIGTAYALPLLIALLFFISRNAMLAYSEYTGDQRNKSLYTKIYSVSALLIALIVTFVLASGTSGIGVNTVDWSLTLSFINLFPILVFFSIVSMAILLSSVVIGIKELLRFRAVFSLLPYPLMGIAILIYLPYLLSSILSMGNMLLLVLLLLLSTALILGDPTRSRAKGIAMALVFLSILFFGSLEYPYFFGGKINVDNYLVNSTTGFYALLITLIGGICLFAALSFFAYVTYCQKPFKQ